MRSMAVGILFLSAVAIAATNLNVKTGLWEITYTTNMQGTMMPKAMLDQMQPAQRAKMQAAMQAQSGKKHITKSCITEKDLQKGAFSDPQEKGCKYTVMKQTATHQEMKVECMSDGEAHSGHMTVDATSNQTMKATIEVETPGGSVTTDMSGRWIAASCGAID